ncbi:MAG TPA: alpha/beta hydrolase [Gemmatimonadaceae bacterium]
MFPAADSRFSTTFLALPLRTGAVTVRVIECGDPSSTRVVFCVHGWACSVYSYRRLMPLLGDAGMRAIAIDLPGHGLSEKPDDARLYTLDAQVECVLAAMDAIGIPRAALVGHSMGAPICARAAVLAPARVAALALLAPVGFGTEWDVRILRAITPRIVAPGLPHLLHRWMVAMVLRSAYGTLYRPTAHDFDEYWAPSQFHGFVRAMWDLLHCFEWSAGSDRGFGTISVPTVIMDGRRDKLAVRRLVRRYVEVLPNAAFTIIDHCGHVIPEEAPDLVSGAIGALIR